MPRFSFPLPIKSYALPTSISVSIFFHWLKSRQGEKLAPDRDVPGHGTGERLPVSARWRHPFFQFWIMWNAALKFAHQFHFPFFHFPSKRFVCLFSKQQGQEWLIWPRWWNRVERTYVGPYMWVQYPCSIPCRGQFLFLCNCPSGWAYFFYEQICCAKLVPRLSPEWIELTLVMFSRVYFLNKHLDLCAMVIAHRREEWWVTTGGGKTVSLGNRFW